MVADRHVDTLHCGCPIIGRQRWVVNLFSAPTPDKYDNRISPRLVLGSIFPVSVS